jgi:predicted helicase
MFKELEIAGNDIVMEYLSNKTMLINDAPVAGIFDNFYMESDLVESANPVFICKSSLVADVCKRDLVEEQEDGRRMYEVVSLQPDEIGFTRIELRLLCT